MTDDCELRLFDVTVHVIPLRPEASLDPEDRADPLLARGGWISYTACAGKRETAIEIALNHFHCTRAISVLDDFDIEAEATVLSAHESAAVLTRTASGPRSGPGIIAAGAEIHAAG